MLAGSRNYRTDLPRCESTGSQHFYADPDRYIFCGIADPDNIFKKTKIIFLGLKKHRFA
jgi:hypothetical protein